MSEWVAFNSGWVRKTIKESVKLRGEEAHSLLTVGARIRACPIGAPSVSEWVCLNSRWVRKTIKESVKLHEAHSLTYGRGSD